MIWVFTGERDNASFVLGAWTDLQEALTIIRGTIREQWACEQIQWFELRAWNGVLSYGPLFSYTKKHFPTKQEGAFYKPTTDEIVDPLLFDWSVREIDFEKLEKLP